MLQTKLTEEQQGRLKPCPFCGCAPKLIYLEYSNVAQTTVYWLECSADYSKCVKPSSHHEDEIEKCIPLWNQRRRKSKKEKISSPSSEVSQG